MRRETVAGGMAGIGFNREQKRLRMGKNRSLEEGWFERRGNSARDLYALGVIAITARGYRALVVPGVITVLLLASLAEGGWFKKRPALSPRRSGSGCSASGGAL